MSDVSGPAAVDPGRHESVSPAWLFGTSERRRSACWPPSPDWGAPCSSSRSLSGACPPDLRDGAVMLAWSAGIVAAVLSVLAVQEHTDPDDDPRYLQTIVHGLRQEWRR